MLSRAVIVRNSATSTSREPFHPPASWLGEMVKCFCGHGIGKHSASGSRCKGDIRGRCFCCLSPSTVLQTAINAEREPVYRD